MQKTQTRNAHDTNTQHTPGPWLLRCNGIFNTNTNPALLVAEIPNLRPYGKRQRTDHDEEQANARFIVAACNSHADLLAALEQCITALSVAVCTCNDDRDCQRCHAARKARAAIARATGDEVTKSA